MVGISEEIGWRGYLLPPLTGLGVWKAVLVSGVPHAVYHLPIILWTPFYHGAGNRLIIVPLFLTTLTLAGICYGYLRLTTASVWPASIAHSTFNIFGRVSTRSPFQSRQTISNIWLARAVS
jgi:membrane protease YdiL (CAAX protease family)